MRLVGNTVCFLLLTLAASNEALAGSYFLIDREVDSGNIIPFAITHPPGYSGSGGTLYVDICISGTTPDDARLAVPLKAAIETWDGRLSTTGNIQGALSWEDGNPISGGAFHAETSLLHELGHCAMGLSHINMGSFSPLGPSSYTKSVGAVSVTDGNNIRGDSEDTHSPAVGVHDLYWFRKMDNDPFAIDSTVIDIDTYSRSVAADLPSGHSYAASANESVAQANGLANTQSIMYGRTVPGMTNTSLVADDVNAVLMGMTGADLEAGTADDYAVQLRYQPTCDSEVEVEVSFASLPFGVAASCVADISHSFPQGLLKFHWTLVPDQGSSALKVHLSTLESWDFGDTIFSAGFEDGDFLEWSLKVP